MAKAVVSRKLSVHKEHEVLLKLETAGLGEDEAQAIVDSRKNGLAATLVKIVRASTADASILESIEEILASKNGASKAETISAGPREWAVWKVAKLGTGIKDADGFRHALQEAGHEIGDWANDIMGKDAFTVAIQESEVELVRVSGRDLGFTKAATRKEIYERANQLGLDTCPPEVGPQLRLQYTDQPKGEWLLVAMDPIAVSDGDLCVFHVERHDDGRSWLYAYYGGPGLQWLPGFVWLFARCKS